MLNRAVGKYHFVSASLFCGVGTGVEVEGRQKIEDRRKKKEAEYRELII